MGAWLLVMQSAQGKVQCGCTWETGRGRGRKGEGLEGLPLLTMVAINEEMVGLLRR